MRAIMAIILISCSKIWYLGEISLPDSFVGCVKIERGHTGLFAIDPARWKRNCINNRNDGIAIIGAPS